MHRLADLGLVLIGLAVFQFLVWVYPPSVFLVFLAGVALLAVGLLADRDSARATTPAEKPIECPNCRSLEERSREVCRFCGGRLATAAAGD